MNDDIVERLRQQATVEAKKFGDARDIQTEWRAAAEIERLRARVEVLTQAVERLINNVETGSFESTGLAIERARAALEAKP